MCPSDLPQQAGVIALVDGGVEQKRLLLLFEIAPRAERDIAVRATLELAQQLADAPAPELAADAQATVVLRLPPDPVAMPDPAADPLVRGEAIEYDPTVST